MTERPGATRSEQIGSMHGEVDGGEAQALCSELDAVYAAAPVALASMTTELMFRRVNERFAKFHGKQIDQFIGKTLSAVLPDRAVAAEAAARQIIKTGEPLDDLSILRTEASGAKHYSESWIPHKSADGRIVGIIIIMAPEAAEYVRGDTGIAPAPIAPGLNKYGEAGERLQVQVDQGSRTEEQLRHAQKMEAVGQLTGGIAHDFNNLLTVVGGNLELIVHRTSASDAVRRLAAAAQEAVTSGQKLIQHLLAFSRRQRLRPRTISVLNTLRDCEDLLRRAAGETVRVEFAIEPTLWPCYVDPGRLEAALLNLTLNARDAMPQGGTLHLAARNVTVGGDRHGPIDLLPGAYVLIAATDSGQGMPRAVVDRAFEPFFTTKPVGKGTGLGLSMLYGFAKQSGGLAAIKSAPRAGTTIELYLPKARDETLQGVRRNGVSDAAPRGSAVVLVVEDDESVLQTVSELLADLGYRTVGATSGAEALTMLQRRRDIDLVLTDVVMPGGMSGIELAREARRRRAGIKVLLTSGYAEEALAESAAHDEFPLIGKPLRQAALGRALHALLTEG